MTKITILTSNIDAVTLDEAVDLVSSWASSRKSRTVVFCNVHSIVTGLQDQSFQNVIAQADLVAPDGAPIAWVMRGLGVKGQRRISGPDFMWRYMAHAEHIGQAIFLYGGTKETLAHLQRRLKASFPALRIAGVHSPPFRPLTQEEDRDIIQTINRSGANTLWVSLGCPKQERWMESHRNGIQAVMLGVGAAFDYHAGTLQRAPLIMQRLGLEWAFRLSQQPRALWRRYLVTNTLFVLALAKKFLLKR